MSSGLRVLDAPWVKEWVLHCTSENQHNWNEENLTFIWSDFWWENGLHEVKMKITNFTTTSDIKISRNAEVLHMFLPEIGKLCGSRWISCIYEVKIKLWLEHQRKETNCGWRAMCKLLQCNSHGKSMLQVYRITQKNIAPSQSKPYDSSN